ncbi:CcoQ/FixQ family Cbb3-type cytochrome c oxidase assembly chaperone [Ahrensia sp. R2A130]|uniref:CcoQ/FixQ family Cbb3-type cytochrome c oxidase assembly chaperone n=1 Tax=Ahrensia sp. R2A130 TaxID=744979 RepID=UPI0001E0C9E9|nr:CcoQ/FixQ family Cbb3-type cytochrome c oxidase assembly chaperone [Ahrensia sp. R2A130]EFL89403.1 cytochrome c oxidase, Cbb3-type, CcoQ subunit [Ahrensia sp. R2A130]
MDYTFMREFADSWGLIYLFLIFIGAVFFTFRPGSKEVADRIARIPFEEDRDDV